MVLALAVVDMAGALPERAWSAMTGEKKKKSIAEMFLGLLGLARIDLKKFGHQVWSDGRKPTNPNPIKIRGKSNKLIISVQFAQLYWFRLNYAQPYSLCLLSIQPF